MSMSTEIQPYAVTRKHLHITRSADALPANSAGQAMQGDCAANLKRHQGRKSRTTRFGGASSSSLAIKSASCVAMSTSRSRGKRITIFTVRIGGQSCMVSSCLAHCGVQSVVRRRGHCVHCSSAGGHVRHGYERGVMKSRSRLVGQACCFCMVCAG